MLQRIVQLEAEAFGVDGLNEWTLVPLARHGRIYCLLLDGDLAGAAQYLRDWDNRGLAYLVGIAVFKRHRGRGLGTDLMKRTLLAMAEDGITEVELTVDPANLAALAVYQNNLGFRVSERRKNEYGEGRDRLVMRVTI